MDNSSKELWIIDDDKIFQILTERMLTNEAAHPLKITQFYDGQEAMNALEENPTNIPDYVLLDINMPLINGWDFLELIAVHHKEMAEKPKIYIVTSSIDKKDKNQALAFSFVKDFLSKPLTKEVIKQIIV